MNHGDGNGAQPRSSSLVAAIENLVVAAQAMRLGLATIALTVVLAGLYVALGATALGLSGILGMAGGLAAVCLVAARGTLRPLLLVGFLVAAAAPFAFLTWWSAATPLMGALLIVMGSAATFHPASTHPASTGVGAAQS